ncbi:hypothetical protein Poli38472_008436 [Pythium oligandrum]|uniref:HIT domain-containing protein n=1 Tax=Pythium oligandrum TaxID=41045 RepID=A0A8K1CMH0_PYTOL|nr:hypothetical protein Poli38472_008436 [Pythium oligandrum]|eukprot:TMW65794.1 hypothetical protein Poli38472_008436 [Pythium oligandrum]
MRLQEEVVRRNIRAIRLLLSSKNARQVTENAALREAITVLQTHGFSVDTQIDGAQAVTPECSKTLVLADREVSTKTTRTSAIIDLANESGIRQTVADLLGVDDPPSTSSRLFGPFLVSTVNIFHQSALSFGLVNLRPIAPGHVLVIPKRIVSRFDALGSDEVSDLWCTAQTVGGKIQSHFNATSLTFAIQDGPDAGQTVPHVHIHVIPRRTGDFVPNDEIYTQIERHERDLGMDNNESASRSQEKMASEASELRALFK